MSEEEIPDPQRQAALQAECGALKVCGKHPSAVFYEGVCAACVAEYEWLVLTRDLE